MYRNTNISVQGIGLQEYFSRVVQYREVRSMCLKMKDAMQTNEEIADLGGTHTHTYDCIRTHTHAGCHSRMCMYDQILACVRNDLAQVFVFRLCEMMEHACNDNDGLAGVLCLRNFLHNRTLGRRKRRHASIESREIQRGLSQADPQLRLPLPRDFPQANLRPKFARAYPGQ